MIEYVNGRQRCDCQCHPDWSGLRFGDTTINFSDIDGIFFAEHAGHFLVFEWKKPGETLSDAQLLMLAQLAALSEFTVYIIHCDRAMGEGMQVQRVWRYQGPPIRACLGKTEDASRAQLQRRITEWYDRVHQYRSRLMQRS